MILKWSKFFSYFRLSLLESNNIKKEINFYINGVKRDQSVITEVSTPVGTANTDVANPLIIGNREDSTATFDGIIDVSYKKDLEKA